MLDVIATMRFARWTGVPTMALLLASAIAGSLLLRHERAAFRTRTLAALRGDQPLLRGLLDSGRKVLAADAADRPGHRLRPDGADAALVADQSRRVVRCRPGMRIHDAIEGDYRRRDYATRRRIDAGRRAAGTPRRFIAGAALSFHRRSSAAPCARASTPRASSRCPRRSSAATTTAPSSVPAAAGRGNCRARARIRR